MALISRRKVLSIATAAGVGALVPFPSRLSAAILSSYVAPKGSSVSPAHSAAPLLASDLLAVSRVSDPSSSARLNDLFPALLVDEGFQQFLPVAFLVTNVGIRDVRAFQLRWTIVTPKGYSEIITQHFLRPHAGRAWRQQTPRGVRGNDKYFSGKIPVVRAGATRLVTPYFCWNATSYERSDRPSWAQLLRWRWRPDIVLSDLADPRSGVAMTIDAAIMDDCTSVGTHGGHLAGVFCVTRNAEHDQAVSVRTRIAAGATQEQVSESLRRDAKGVDFKFRTNSPYDNIYYIARTRQAKVLLRRLENAGWDKFLGTLEYLRSQPKTRKGTVNSQSVMS